MPVCSIWEFPTPGLDISSEETIQFNLEKARCPKDKNALYNDVKVKLESQGILAYNVILQFINEELERVPGYTEVFKPFIVRECFICELETSTASLPLFAVAKLISQPSSERVRILKKITKDFNFLFR